MIASSSQKVLKNKEKLNREETIWKYVIVGPLISLFQRIERRQEFQHLFSMNEERKTLIYIYIYVVVILFYSLMDGFLVSIINLNFRPYFIILNIFFEV